MNPQVQQPQGLPLPPPTVPAAPPQPGLALTVPQALNQPSGCYCGCGTRRNKVLWLIASILLGIMTVFWIAAIICVAQYDDESDGEAFLPACHAWPVTLGLCMC